jgi:UDP-N-acetylglucosamine 4-epimerase
MDNRPNSESTLYAQLRIALRAQPRRWLVTGAAGFIGSNIIEELLRLDQLVIGLDNFATGSRLNLLEVQKNVGDAAWQRFQLLHGDITDIAICKHSVRGVDHVLHQAALGSVPRSLADPIASHAANVTGFLNVMVAAKEAGVRSFVYAASSSTYGDDQNLPKVENRVGVPLSPYAATKLANEIYAAVFARCYGFSTIGLRYFNVFGSRQDPLGAYAAVIPKWIAAMIKHEIIVINGDGETSRDFCYVDNVVQANLLSSCAPQTAQNEIYNVAVGTRTSLNELFVKLQSCLALHQVRYELPPQHMASRPGDVRHSLADISKATQRLGYAPTETIDSGIAKIIPWYIERFRSDREMLEP